MYWRSGVNCGAWDSPTEYVQQEFFAPSVAGVYEVCVRGTDALDNVGAPECAFLVAYDPSGGFVTGGGWIDSPAGAYAPDPTLTGKANFGFVSKYSRTQRASLTSRSVALLSSNTRGATNTIPGGITNPVSAQNRTLSRPTAHSPKSRKPEKRGENAIADWSPEAEIVGSNPAASAMIPNR